MRNPRLSQAQRKRLILWLAAVDGSALVLDVSLLVRQAFGDFVAGLFFAACFGVVAIAAFLDNKEASASGESLLATLVKSPRRILVAVGVTTLVLALANPRPPVFQVAILLQLLALWGLAL